MSVERWRKKPVVVDTILYTGANADEVIGWARSYGVEIVDGGGCLLIPTLEGEMRADIGDRVIKGLHGEFYPNKPHTFAATYEPVTP